MKTSQLLIFSLALLSCQATVTKAALIAYDGFGDGANAAPLPGLGGGTGFSGNWSAFFGANFIKHYNAPQPGDPSYFYPSNVSLGYTSGVVQQDSAYSTTGSYQRQFNGNTIDLGADGQYFISYIFRSFFADSDGQATVNLASSGAVDAEALQFGYIWNDRFTTGLTTATSATFGGESGLATSDVFAGNTTYFVIGMINASASSPDEIFLKAYNASTELVAADSGLLSGVGTGIDQWSIATSFSSNAVFDRLGITASGVGLFSLDEVRVGTSWQDITAIPEPSTFALLISFVAGMAVWRRRACSTR